MKVIIGLLVAVLLALGLVFYGLFGSGATTNDRAVTSGNNQPSAEAPTAAEEPESFSGETTLAELRSLGPQLECRISYVEPETAMPIVGTYFVNGEQIRGDFEMSSPDFGDFVSSIIMTEGQFYSWSTIAGQTFGVKADLAAMDETESEQLREPVPSDETVSYECERWEDVDGSIFLPPGDVLFQDVEGILEAGMEIGTTYEGGEF